MKTTVLMLMGLAAGTIAVAQVPQLASGSIVRLENFGSGNVQPRNIDVWLPEGYGPKQKYPVLYMHDGQMLFDSTITWNRQEWGVDEVAGKLIGSGRIRPFIVVGIWNSGPGRHAEYCPEKPLSTIPASLLDSLTRYAGRNPETVLFDGDIRSDEYLRFIVSELKPHIDKNFSTLRTRENTFIAGSSMGGLISLYAICEYPDVFGGAACLSTHWPVLFTADDNPFPSAILQYLKASLPVPSTHKLYFDYGTGTLDVMYEPWQKQADAIVRAGGYTTLNWRTMKVDGADHSENTWRKRLDVPLLFLLGK